MQVMQIEELCSGIRRLVLGKTENVCVQIEKTSIQRTDEHTKKILLRTLSLEFLMLIPFEA